MIMWGIKWKRLRDKMEASGIWLQSTRNTVGTLHNNNSQFTSLINTASRLGATAVCLLRNPASILAPSPTIRFSWLT